MARLGYCSACDRNVPVALRKPLEHRTTPGASDPRALVCLDYGVRCTGNLCPMFTVPRSGGQDGSAARRPEVRAP